MNNPNQAKAAIFDLDKTILATSSALAMRKPLRKAGMLSRSDELASTLVQIPFLLFGEAEARNDRVRKQLGKISNGWQIDNLNEIAQAAALSAMRPLCYVEALDRIEMHKAAGYKVVIATASPSPLVQPLADLLGADYMLATTVTVRGGQLTGEVTDFNHGKYKADAVERLAKREGWDLSKCWAYSDSISDLDLLGLVGHPVAVNPDRQLRGVARENQWEITRFQRTVQLRPKDFAARALAVTALAATGIASIYLISRSSLKDR
ncbi:MAG: HAD family hydrolase [Actinomycetaceae bacterium]|nr:HAD family hydrolase [Actinomycetaceae bacterium]